MMQSTFSYWFFSSYENFDTIITVGKKPSYPHQDAHGEPEDDLALIEKNSDGGQTVFRHGVRFRWRSYAPYTGSDIKFFPTNS